MSNLTELRKAAREIFDDALRAVDAGAAVRKTIRLDGPELFVCDRRIDPRGSPIYSIALGKAAIPMARALEERLGSKFTQGVIAGPVISRPTPFDSNQADELTRWQIFEGGHPVPNQQSLNAAAAAFALLDRANVESANVIFLISGGGSAMLEWPISEGITLDDIRKANKVLVNCGADITEINAIRRAFSAVKGGRLAERAPNCQQITLIISDVRLGEESIVASGPTAAAPSMTRHTSLIVERYKLRKSLPPTIIRALESTSTAPTTKLAHHWSFALLNNNDALAAAVDAAASRGLVSEIAHEITDLPIEEGVRALTEHSAAMRARHRGNDKPLCLISGGEFACPVRGAGVGGRNLETALRLALLNSGGQQLVALCAGTDGIDGNSLAAGAIIDNTTIERAKGIGLDAEDFVRRSDSYSFLHTLGDDIITGPTGTNVRDIRILLTMS